MDHNSADFGLGDHRGNEFCEQFKFERQGFVGGAAELAFKLAELDRSIDGVADPSSTTAPSRWPRTTATSRA